MALKFGINCFFYSQVRNEKARRYLSSMRKKETISFSQKFPNADPLALDLLQRLLAFDPKDRPTAEEVIMLLQSPESRCILMFIFGLLWANCD